MAIYTGRIGNVHLPLLPLLNDFCMTWSISFILSFSYKLETYTSFTKGGSASMHKQSVFLVGPSPRHKIGEQLLSYGSIKVWERRNCRKKDGGFTEEYATQNWFAHPPTLSV